MPGSRKGPLCSSLRNNYKAPVDRTALPRSPLATVAKAFTPGCSQFKRLGL